ncbi:aldehyde dehydrogenase family protein [Ichthyenterobacterium sp. W332]|uniref:Aldehyde dehydrogenase n=1 Tax=Microcosmobacter mediterraneus TaxID=3075607 RepID=A0ABU2YMK0_9FLAO|nr:aldehyde dehydrogenase family protein [Ichthyenterobacterium sp. W332]MDT0558914.1 aldehyde dehydrogenase family protein [Ichthyenterobacterium sp. W332]
MNFDDLLNKQHLFFDTQSTKDLKFRKQQLKKLKQLLIANESKLNEAVYKDFKRSSKENLVLELYPMYKTIKTILRKLDRWTKSTKVSTNILNIPAKSYIKKEPLGSVLVIGAWNYPIQLSLLPAIYAISAGNTVIIKPSEIPSHTSKVITELINSNFDEGFLKVVEGGIPETTALLNLKFDKVFFTGSTVVGKIVYQAAARNLTDVTLELGGKSPAIFTKDANLKMGVKRLVWSKYLNAGQTCLAPDYVLVDESIKERFLELVYKEIEQHNYSIHNENYVQIIDNKNFKRLEGLIDKDKVSFGGETDENERLIYPTVMTDITLEDKIMSEEIFGPILPVLSFNNLDEALHVVKQFEKPLSLYLHTKKRNIKRKILNEISFGGGCVNESVMHYTNSELPFGGVGHSGIGSYHGKFGFDTFSHQKAIMDKPSWFELNLKYYKRTTTKVKLIKALILSMFRY